MIDVSRYIEAKERAKTLPHIEVSRTEFIRRLVATGESQEKAERTATIAEGLGSQIEIDGFMVSVSPEGIENV